MGVAQEQDVLFEDIATEAGIDFVHISAPEAKYIMESMSAGVMVLDYDNDGLTDIYLTNALTTKTAKDMKSAASALYRNLGDLKFKDVSETAGVQYPGWATGGCIADYNGDGFQDIYVTVYGERNVFYRNNGDGTFTDVAVSSGAAGNDYCTGCGFADYDRDGDLDLFVARYVHVDIDNLPVFGQGKTCRHRGIAVQCGPRGLPGLGDLMFRNNGNGTFEEVSKEVGVHDPDKYYGLGVSWFDYNDDGWLDLYVANDATPSYMYTNQQDGTFAEDAFFVGVAVSEDGAEQGCMGVAIGDYAHEGRFSIYVANFAEEYSALYHNEGEYFSDASFPSGTAPATMPYVSWNPVFIDYDNNGWEDILMDNGHVYPQLGGTKMGASAGFKQRRLLFRNLGDGTFNEIAAKYGDVLMEDRVSRGIGMADFDNDGRVDAIINDLVGPPQLLHNIYPNPGNWLQVKLVGKGKLTDAIGAVIKVKAGDLQMMRLIRSGTGYCSQDDMRQHFGLASATKVDKLEVVWPDGTSTTKENVEANQILVITQK